MIHFVEEDDSLRGLTGIIIESEKGLWGRMMLALAFTWPVRRWHLTDYDEVIEHVKPRPWVRVSLIRNATIPLWMSERMSFASRWRWLWSVFVVDRGIEYVDADRTIGITFNSINVTHICKEPA
jgi:hypothetical protein